MAFVAERRIYTTEYDALFLEKKFRAVERLYNAGVKYCLGRIRELEKDIWYRKALGCFSSAPDTSAHTFWAGEVFACAENYGLTEYQIHAYLGKGKVSAYGGCVGINIVQKAGTQLWAGVKKALFGKKLHFRKYGSTRSFEDKKASSGIICKGGDSVKILGRVMELKPVRETDAWLKEALSHKVKYCRVVRRPFGKSFRYFLQLVLDGVPPQKHFPGKGTSAVDPGVSTMAVYNGKELSFLVLSPDIRKYQEAVFRAQKKYSRLLRLNNPGCFLPDGTFRKGARIRHTVSMRKAAMEVKTAFRKQAEYVKQQNHRMCNRILEAAGSILKLEPMDYSALQKRSRKTQRQEKLSEVKTKSGVIKEIHKYRRKKRFGKSILKHAPGGFLQCLADKVSTAGGAVMEIDIRKYRASQYDHAGDAYRKQGLDCREKIVGGHLVQRDCYSSFLVFHAETEECPDREACLRDFDNYLDCQQRLVERLKQEHFSNPNFGTKLLTT